MPLFGKTCPDCRRTIRTKLVETITGRLVCRECAHALFAGTLTGVSTGSTAAGTGVLGMLLRRIRRSG